MHIETLTYLFLWILPVIYSVYCFSISTSKYFRSYKDEYEDFTEGIIYLPKRDKADLEWEGIIFLVKEYFPWILIYILFSQTIRYHIKSLQVVKLWQIVFTVTYVLLKWNYIFLLLLLFQPVLLHTVKVLYPKKSSIWTLSCICLVLLNYIKSIINNPEILKKFKIKDYEIYILVCSLFWMNLKCTSFCLENNQKSDFLDMLSYCLYPPLVFSGPFILYKDFVKIYTSDIKLWLWKYKKLAKNIIKLLFWFNFVYICLHYVYVNAIVFHPQTIENFDSWSLYGFGYTMGQFFHLKYIIQYGLSTSIASFENIDVPNLPRCIGRIHLYSDMWKFFDPGLYNFLTKNIYLPMVQVTQNKPIRSFLCFFFVYMWHGLETHILIWTMLNYLGILLENIIFSKEIKINNKSVQEQPSWKLRKHCFMAAFLLAMSAISNFYFFAGTDVGHVFFRRIFTDIFGSTILIAALYCCCQVSTELRTVVASKM